MGTHDGRTPPGVHQPGRRDQLLLGANAKAPGRWQPGAFNLGDPISVPALRSAVVLSENIRRLNLTKQESVVAASGQSA
jgi:hypothetical protein